MKILAIDLGQSKSVSCEFDTDSGEYRFKTFDTTGPPNAKVISPDPIGPDDQAADIAESMSEIRLAADNPTPSTAPPQ